MRNNVFGISSLIVLLGLFTVSSFTVFAQSSAFGDLNDNKDVGSSSVTTDGQTLESYEKALDEYTKLVTAYSKSYGPQRIALEKQVLAKAKEAMSIKLGVVQTFLQNLKTKSVELNLFKESDKNAYDAGLVKYQNYVVEKNKDINTLASITALTAYSKSLNKELFLGMQFSEVYLAKISVTRGRYMIEKLMVLAPIIQAQINTSSDVGGDVADIQQLFDDSMLQLETLKSDYSEIEKLIAVENISKTSASDFMNNTRSANSKMVSAYNGITDVVTKLRTLYAQAPWDEKLVEQLLEGQKTLESTSSSEEVK